MQENRNQLEQAIKSKYGENWRFSYSDDQTIFHRMSGTCMLKSGIADTDDATTHAFSVLTDLRNLIRIPITDFQKSDVTFDGFLDRFEVVFQQYFGGLPVEGGKIFFSMRKNGELYNVSNRAIPDLQISTRPDLSQEEAANRLVGARNYPYLTTETPAIQLVIMPANFIEPGSGAHLCYKMVYHEQTFYIDAFTGNVVFEISNYRRELPGSGLSGIEETLPEHPRPIPVASNLFSSMSSPAFTYTGTITGQVYPLNNPGGAVFNQNLDGTYVWFRHLLILEDKVATNSNGAYTYETSSERDRVRTRLESDFIEVLNDQGDEQEGLHNYSPGELVYDYTFLDAPSPGHEANVYYNLTDQRHWFDGTYPGHATLPRLSALTNHNFSAGINGDCNGSETRYSAEAGQYSHTIRHEYSHFFAYRQNGNSWLTPIPFFFQVGTVIDRQCMNEAFAWFYPAAAMNDANVNNPGDAFNLASPIQPFDYNPENYNILGHLTSQGNGIINEDDHAHYFNQKVVASAWWQLRNTLGTASFNTLLYNSLDGVNSSNVMPRDFYNELLQQDDNDNNPYNRTPHFAAIDDAYAARGMYYYPRIASVDNSANPKTTFSSNENVYVHVSRCPTNENVRIYIVEHKDTWTNGETLNDVSGGYETLAVGNSGENAKFLVWNGTNRSNAGDFDIIVDVNCDGKYDFDFDGRIDGKCSISVTGVEIAFVIDDTGSMLEDIDGVKNALLYHLATYTGNNTVFQLTTFKDDYTIRASTTDLAEITNQVAGLSAWGGGDCPEASVEALTAIAPGLMYNARVFIATDAAPHPGLNLESAIALLKAKGARVDVVLSGDCGEGKYLAQNQDDNSEIITSQDPQPDNSTTYNAVDAYSLIASETGGVFSFRPDVNTGNAIEVERYTYTVFNIVQGGMTHSLVLTEPPYGNKNSSVTLSLVGSKTNFQLSTTVVFNDPGITVSSVNVISPTEMTVSILITGSATTGFKNIQAITDFGGGVTEIANGIEAFEVKAATSAPSIVSVTPFQGFRGEDLMVTIKGINTHFNATSVPTLGSDITINQKNVLSDTVLEAAITIQPSASIGYRDVSVVTGSENATEGFIGPFFVANLPPIIPMITSVVPGSGNQGESVTINITGQNTSFQAGVSALSFSGSGIQVLNTLVNSPTSLTANILVDGNASPGFRDVFVITATETAVLLNGFQVTLIPPVPTFTVSPNDTTCVSEDIEYSTQTGQSTYIWAVQGTLNTDFIITAGSLGSTSHSVTLRWLTTGGKNVMVNYTAPNGAAGLVPAVSVTTAYARPVPSFTVAPGASSCSGVNITYTTQPGQIAYTWDIPGIPGTDYSITAGGTGTGNQTVTLKWLTTGSKTVTVNYQNTYGCNGLNPATAITQINQVPLQPSVITGSSSPCVSSSQTYSVISVPGTGYAWTFPAGWVQTGGGTTNSVTVTVGNGPGNIQVTPSNTCGNGPAQYLGVSPLTTPSQPGPISGGTSPCLGYSYTYSVPSVPGVSYSWTFPSGWTQTGGGNTNESIVTIGSGSGNIQVTPSNVCGNGPIATLAVTSTTVPASAGAISGNTAPCLSTSKTYSVAYVAGVLYNWTFPSGWIQTGGGMTNAVTVTVGSGSGSIKVIPFTACGSGPQSTLAVTVSTVPAQPGPITGNATPCISSSQTYSISNVTGLTYTWTFPSGWVQTAGGTTNSVTVTVGSTSGTITVTPSNLCGIGPTPRTLSVTPMTTPANPGTISYVGALCTGSSVTFSVVSVPGINYAWTLPSGWTQTGGGSGNSITATVGSASGTVLVTPINACGTGPNGHLAVTPSSGPSQPGTITGNTTPCVGYAENYSVPTVAGVSYSWVLPGGWSQISGGTSNSISASVGSSSGNIQVTPTNQCGSGTARTLAVSPVTLPVQPSVITGNPSPTPGSSQGYSVTAVPGVTYAWVFPSGWVQTGGGTTNSVTVTVGSGVGTIQVTPLNACGTGPSQTKVVPLQQTVPNMTVGAAQSLCYNAIQNVTVSGSFIVLSGGSAVMVAGAKVLFQPNVKVNSGGYMHGYISTNGQYCVGTKVGISVVDNNPIPWQDDTEASSLFRIYPNPTTGSFQIELTGETGPSPVLVDIFSARGEKIASFRMVADRTAGFSISDKRPGLYLIRVNTGTNVVTRRIVKL
ncbi:MAG TPA: T9SS type A sorting domain-containing protein [Bacteroidales bacterium]|nr:T9SS type A sorting domain-containing protein [Bacteroidales bacterium]